MSASSGPYSNPGVTGATTGPYAGPTVLVTPGPEPRCRVSVLWPDGLTLRGSWHSDEATATAEAERVRAALAAAATPAPPVDVAARLRAAAKVVGDRGPTSYALNHLAEYLEQHANLPPAQAIARALTGEATDAD